jgi:hypothetical protein
MRRPIVLAALAAGAAMALWTVPSSAMQRLAEPSGAQTLVRRVADMDRYGRRRHARAYRGDSAYWHYRLSAARWLHYQHVNAGYPARRYRGHATYIYVAGDPCCGYRRDWPWMGRRHWHGPRHWHWIGRRCHHRHW